MKKTLPHYQPFGGDPAPGLTEADQADTFESIFAVDLTEAVDLTDAVLDDPHYRTAMHEAAHAVAAVVAGPGVRRAFAGRAKGWVEPREAATAKEALGLVVAVLAAELMEQAAFGSCHGSHGDREQALDLCLDLARGDREKALGLLKRSREKAAGLVQRVGVRWAVEKVAFALMEADGRPLSGKRIARLVRG